jgi:hypothetical protein
VDGESGRKSLAALEDNYGVLPETLTSTTGRDDGGEHRFFLYPIGREIRSRTNALGEGLDVRAIGGCVIVPPSIHPSGRLYRWRAKHQVVAAPDWLLQLATERKGDLPARSAPDFHGLSPGWRNDGLTRFGGKLRRAGVTREEIEDALLTVNESRCRPPLAGAEVRRIAASVARYEVGGPDPLERAWEAAKANSQNSLEAQFWELCRQLQIARPVCQSSCRLKRSPGLMRVHWTTVSGYRKRAVTADILAHF